MGDHDWYCYDCHRPGSVLECSECWRVFHMTCTDDYSELDSEDTFVCAVCKVVPESLSDWYGDGVDNTLEDNSSVFSLVQMQGHAGSKTLHQQNPPVLNWGCRLMQVDVYNGFKTVVVPESMSVVIQVTDCQETVLTCRQGDHFSRKPVNNRKFHRCQNSSKI